MLVYLLIGNLPWSKLTIEAEETQNNNVFASKLSFIPELHMQEFPEEFIVFLNYSKALEYEEDPNYQFLIGLFKNLANKLDFH